ncbi:serine hydrolase domain-containing protein [Crossiella sp. CA198]|uniref:serine hydrolase domain-containing protein n=1 Tax=Crossiella sp. CA198 TaxID=3455607 RepID=UPI003F8D2753
MTEFESPGRDNVRAAMDTAVRDLGAPSVAVRIQDENGTWFGSAGLADTVTGAPRVPEERLHTGSISKAFTAATVLRLEAEGKLDLEDTVQDWLPGVLDGSEYDGSKITIRHLLSNSSGLFATGMALEFQRRVTIRSAFDAHRFEVWPPAEVLRVALSQPPVGAPGERFWYSNGGFAFAAAIVEKATGNSFESEVHRTVIAPLGLRHTFARHREETGYRGRHPRAYAKIFLKEGVRPEDVRPDNWPDLMEDPSLPPLDVTEANTSWGWGAANVVSTLDELIVFFNAMITGSLLPERQHRELWTTIPTAGSHWIANTAYGLGLYELTLSNGLKLRGSGGQSFGTCTLVLGTPDGKHTIAVHTNNDWAPFPVLDKIIEAEFGASGFVLDI